MKLLGEFVHSQYRKHRSEEVVALGNLDAPTYQVVYQSKTVFTALASRMLLAPTDAKV